ncbi:MAG: hypothetical protein JXQ69_06390 [Paludibacteraceae bacterium]|nr:hypothetical protein [Paludibacteraceae bacterium]MBN2787938.1 hypothetical protein [Paludibacteraceae bacterium]
MKIYFILFFSLCSIVNFYAQQVLSAEIFFSVTYKGIAPDELMGMPKQISYLVSGNNTKQTVVTGETTMRVIANADSVFLANLTDIEDDRVGILYYADDIAASLSIFDIKIKKTRETKTILGYPCKKYIITVYNKETKEKMKDIVFVTERIGGEDVNFLLYKGLKGFILSSQKINGDEITTMTAKRIIKKEIAPTEFFVPEEYTITTYKEQLKQDK